MVIYYSLSKFYFLFSFKCLDTFLAKWAINICLESSYMNKAFILNAFFFLQLLLLKKRVVKRIIILSVLLGNIINFQQSYLSTTYSLFHLSSKLSWLTIAMTNPTSSNSHQVHSFISKEYWWEIRFHSSSCNIPIFYCDIYFKAEMWLHSCLQPVALNILHLFFLFTFTLTSLSSKIFMSVHKLFLIIILDIFIKSFFLCVWRSSSKFFYCQCFQFFFTFLWLSFFPAVLKFMLLSHYTFTNLIFRCALYFLTALANLYTF